jgi:hypothetical protein
VFNWFETNRYPGLISLGCGAQGLSGVDEDGCGLAHCVNEPFQSIALFSPARWRIRHRGRASRRRPRVRACGAISAACHARSLRAFRAGCQGTLPLRMLAPELATLHDHQ